MFACYLEISKTNKWESRERGNILFLLLSFPLNLFWIFQDSTLKDAHSIFFPIFMEPSTLFGNSYCYTYVLGK